MWNSHRWSKTHFVKDSWQKMATEAIFVATSHPTNTEMKFYCQGLVSTSSFVVMVLGARNSIFLSKIGALHPKADTVVMKLTATNLGMAGGREAFASEGQSCRCRLGDGVLTLGKSGSPAPGQRTKKKQGDEVVRGTSSLTHGGLSVSMATLLPPTKSSVHCALPSPPERATWGLANQRLIAEFL